MWKKILQRFASCDWTYGKDEVEEDMGSNWPTPEAVLDWLRSLDLEVESRRVEGGVAFEADGWEAFLRDDGAVTDLVIYGHADALNYERGRGWYFD